MFSNINKLRIYDNAIYILDIRGANSLLKFDIHGNFITKIGQRGSGPKEYRRLWDFDIDSTSIYLYDRAKMKILIYDHNGQFICENNVPFRIDQMKLLSNNKYLVSLAKEDNLFELITTDNKFNIIDKHIFYNEKYNDNKMTDNLYQEVDNLIIYNKPVNDSLYIYDKSGNMLKCINFDFGKHKVPEELKLNYEELANMRDKEDFIYFYDSPMIIDNILIGNIFKGKYKATLIYDLNTQQFFINEYKPKSIDFNNICFPIFATKKYVISILDITLFENLKKKPNINNTHIRHLEEGGRILCMYHLK